MNWSRKRFGKRTSSVLSHPLCFQCFARIATGKYSGKKRVIFDSSAPRSGPLASVNSLIPPELLRLYYASVENAIEFIKLAGGAHGCPKQTSRTRFYRVPIHTSQWHRSVGFQILLQSTVDIRVQPMYIQ